MILYTLWPMVRRAIDNRTVKWNVHHLKISCLGPLMALLSFYPVRTCYVTTSTNENRRGKTLKCLRIATDAHLTVYSTRALFNSVKSLFIPSELCFGWRRNGRRVERNVTQTITNQKARIKSKTLVNSVSGHLSLYQRRQTIFSRDSYSLWTSIILCSKRILRYFGTVNY